MTLIASCRYGTQAVYVYDIRVTKEKQHSDALLKWLFFDERIGILTAGPIGFWKDVEKRINSDIDKINIDNIFAEDGPFREIVLDAALAYGGSLRDKAGALGYIIDRSTDSNKQFRIDVQLCGGARISEIACEEGVVIGGGALVPSMESTVRSAAKTCRKIFEKDLFALGDCLRRQIISCMEAAGSSSFIKVGVSPVMALGILDSAGFYIPKEDFDGIKLINGVWRDVGYTIGCDHDGRIVLTDGITGESLQLTPLAQDAGKYDGRTIDPERLTVGIDVTGMFPGEEVVYRFRQVASRELNPADYPCEGPFADIARILAKPENAFFRSPHTYRSFSRIKVDAKGLCTEVILCGKLQKDVSENHLQISGELHFLLLPEYDGEVTQDHLFDEAWLSDHVEGYKEAFLYDEKNVDQNVTVQK